MFRRLPDLPGARLRLTVDGAAIEAREGDTVSAAMLAAGLLACRTTPVSGSPRAPYCMMGVCFECLCTVDGVGNRQGCMTAARDGMRVETQRGARALDYEGLEGLGQDVDLPPRDVLGDPVPEEAA